MHNVLFVPTLVQNTFSNYALMVVSHEILIRPHFDTFSTLVMLQKFQNVSGTFFLSEQRSTFLLTEYFLRSETYATLEDFLSLVEDYLDISLHCLVEWLVTLVQIISHCASCVGCTKFLYK